MGPHMATRHKHARQPKHLVIPDTYEFDAQAMEDALIYIHQGVVPADLERRIGLLHPLDAFDALDTMDLLVVPVAMQGFAAERPEHVALLKGLPPRVIDRLPLGCMSGGLTFAPDEPHRLLDWWATTRSVPDGVDWGAMLRWLRSDDATEAQVDRVLPVACRAMPPVLVAIALATRGMLTEERYAVVAETPEHEWTLPDYAALARFTPLVEQRQPEKLQALRGVSVMAVRHASFPATSMWSAVKSESSIPYPCGTVTRTRMGNEIRVEHYFRQTFVKVFALSATSILHGEGPHNSSFSVEVPDDPETEPQPFFPHPAFYVLVARTCPRSTWRRTIESFY